MKISSNGIKLIKGFEALRLEAYKDIAGVWTIGYGHTGNVSSGMIISESQAEQYLMSDIAVAERALQPYSKLNQNQYDALVSFFFNVGTGWIKEGNFDPLLKNPDSNVLAAKIMKYVYAKGKISQGLINRRTKEAELLKKKVM